MPRRPVGRAGEITDQQQLVAFRRKRQDHFLQRIGVIFRPDAMQRFQAEGVGIEALGPFEIGDNQLGEAKGSAVIGWSPRVFSVCGCNVRQASMAEKRPSG